MTICIHQESNDDIFIIGQFFCCIDEPYGICSYVNKEDQCPKLKEKVKKID